jgi:L-alanine-DL-glutamate epimerase-like enolase superfamily enzyme
MFHSNIEHIWQLVWRLGFYRGGPVFMSALSGIDIALWDLKGSHKRLSKKHPKPDAYVCLFQRDD